MMDEIRKGGLISDTATRLKSFVIQSKRVWHILRKPTSEEFKTVSKVSALGLLVIGAIGFLISDLIKIVGNVFS